MAKLQALGGEAENLRTRVDELSRKTREQESVTDAIKRETTTFRALNQEHEKHIRVLKKAMQVRRRSETCPAYMCCSVMIEGFA